VGEEKSRAKRIAIRFALDVSFLPHFFFFARSDFLSPPYLPLVSEDVLNPTNSAVLKRQTARGTFEIGFVPSLPFTIFAGIDFAKTAQISQIATFSGDIFFPSGSKTKSQKLKLNK